MSGREQTAAFASGGTFGCLVSVLWPDSGGSRSPKHDVSAPVEMPVPAGALRFILGIVVQVVQQRVVVRAYGYLLPGGKIGAFVVREQRMAAFVKGVKPDFFHAGAYHRPFQTRPPRV